jgi:hypothetical protein
MTILRGVSFGVGATALVSALTAPCACGSRADLLTNDASGAFPDDANIECSSGPTTGVRCGAVQCQGATPVCCYNWVFLGAILDAQCLPAGGDCHHLGAGKECPGDGNCDATTCRGCQTSVYQCDDASDCPAGEVCCYHTFQGASCEASCPPSSATQLQPCHDDCECTNGSTRCLSVEDRRRPASC